MVSLHNELGSDVPLSNSLIFSNHTYTCLTILTCLVTPMRDMVFISPTIIWKWLIHLLTYWLFVSQIRTYTLGQTSHLSCHPCYVSTQNYVQFLAICQEAHVASLFSWKSGTIISSEAKFSFFYGLYSPAKLQSKNVAISLKTYLKITNSFSFPL